jgi:hypothetical protein
MKKIIVFCLLMIIGLHFTGKNGFSAEKDPLIDKLVEKNVLTKEEAAALVSHPQKSSQTLPQWLENLKLYGDLRFRYQYEDKETVTSGVSSIAQRERARFRLRLGLSTEIDEFWTVQAGLASGSSDLRSTNQTFENNSSSKNINIDYAYAKYKIFDQLDVMAGKIQSKNVIWAPSQLVWDSDVNPEGIIAGFKSEDTGFWLNSGYFILDEMSRGADPSLCYIQPGITVDIEDIEVKGALNYFAANSIQGRDYSNIVSGSGTNTLETVPGSFKYDYDCWGISAQAGWNNFQDSTINYIALFFDYIHNPDPENQNTGHLIGLKFGDKNIKEAKQWQFRTTYRKLGKDAWLDFLTHSDFLSGKTDSKGYSAGIRYGISKNVVLAATYYNAETIKSVVKEEEELLQLDCNLKF